MTGARDRAVCVAFHDDLLLVIGRHKDGQAYCVLPGGGVEPGEEPKVAVLRELAEETGLLGTVQRPLWTIDHHDRRAHYFLVTVHRGPMNVGGPEASLQSTANVYAPKWLPLNRLEAEGLQPDSICHLLRGVEPEAR